MRFKILLVCVCCFLFSVVNAFSDEKKTVSNGPEMVVPEPSYTFEQVLEGEEVLHDFIIQNKGTSDLIIKKVKPG